MGLPIPSHGEERQYRSAQIVVLPIQKAWEFRMVQTMKPKGSANHGRRFGRCHADIMRLTGSARHDQQRNPDRRHRLHREVARSPHFGYHTVERDWGPRATMGCLNYNYLGTSYSTVAQSIVFKMTNTTTLLATTYLTSETVSLGYSQGAYQGASQCFVCREPGPVVGHDAFTTFSFPSSTSTPPPQVQSDSQSSENILPVSISIDHAIPHPCF